MAKYCKTYNVICTCVTCENVECGYSPRTRAEAEIARGVKLDKYGKIIGEEAPASPHPVMASNEALIRELPQAQVDTWRGKVVIALIAVMVLVVFSALGIVLWLHGRSTPVINENLVAQAPMDSIPDVNAETPDLIPMEPEPVEEESIKLPPPTPEMEPEPEPTPEPKVEEEAQVPPFEKPQSEMMTATRDLAPPETQEERRLRELKEKGNEFVHQRDYTKAREFYQKAIEENPEYYPGFSNLGSTFSDEGNFAEAEPLYLKGLEIQPDSTNLIFNMGNNWFRQHRYAQALQAMNRLLALDPQDVEGHLIAGVCSYKMGNYEMAKMHFKAVTQLDPRNAEAYYNLHLSCRQMGDWQNAIAYLKEAVRLRPQLRDSKYRRKFSVKD